MTPFAIVAEMTEPTVYFGDGLHIDGPLAYGAYMDLPLEQREQVPSISSAWAVDFDLPLEKWEGPAVLLEGTDPRLTTDRVITADDDGLLRGTVWGWRASAAIPLDVPVEGLHELRKKIEVGRMSFYTGAKSHNVGTGPMKGRNMKFPTTFVRRFRWYLNGDSDRALWLLRKHVHAIGKLSRHGMGRVKEWMAEEVERDKSVMDGGRIMRRLPHSMAAPESDRYGLGAIRPPYHHRSRICRTVEPEVLECSEA